MAVFLFNKPNRFLGKSCIGANIIKILLQKAEMRNI